MNLRVTKKDIEFLVNDYITDCMVFNDFHSGKKEDKVLELISEALVFSDGLMVRVNKPLRTIKNEKGKEITVKLSGKEIKAHYRAINKDLLEGFDNLFEKLGSLTK